MCVTCVYRFTCSCHRAFINNLLKFLYIRIQIIILTRICKAQNDPRIFVYKLPSSDIGMLFSPCCDVQVPTQRKQLPTGELQKDSRTRSKVAAYRSRQIQHDFRRLVSSAALFLFVVAEVHTRLESLTDPEALAV